MWSCLAVVLLLGNGCERFRRQTMIRAPFFQENQKAVEALLDAMSMEQKLAQLLMVEVEADSAVLQNLYADAQKGLLGGVIIRNLHLEHFRAFADSIRAVSPFPVWIGTLETALLNNQFCDAAPFPEQITIDAATDETDRAAMEKLLRRQAAVAGINWSLEPPLYRGAVWSDSSGLPRRDYAAPTRALREWRQEGMVRLGNAFSHLLYIPKDTARLTEQMLAPYRKLARAGVAGFWLDSSVVQPGKPFNYLRDYFEEKLRFEGLLAGAGSVEDLIWAGADLVVIADTLSRVRGLLMQMYKTRKLSSSELNRRVRRILAAKHWSEVRRPPALARMLQDSLLAVNPSYLFNNADLAYQAQRIREHSVVVLQGRSPLTPLQPGRVRLVLPPDDPFSPFKKYFRHYADPDTVVLWNADTALWWDTAVVTVVLRDSRQVQLARDKLFYDLLSARPANARLILVHFGEPQRLVLADTNLVVIQAFERHTHTEQAAAGALWGAVGVHAKLPDRVGERWMAGAGVVLPQVRLRFATPRNVGISPEKLVGIDAIAHSAIQQRIIPGCQVLVVIDGQVIYSKAFGKHTFNGGYPVTEQTLYDIASITKVAATTLALMQLKDQGKMTLDEKVQDVIPQAKGEVGQISVRQLLTHTSGLQANMPVEPYIKAGLTRRMRCNNWFCRQEQPGYTVPVAKDFYFRNEERAHLLASLYRLPVQSPPGMRYSDVNMIILQQMIEKASGVALDTYVQKAFYMPLGLRRLTYRPLQRFALHEIAPTENDLRWRQQVVHGYVHDPAAALLGGISGNAGLFANAEDLAVIFQMLLNEGSYGGRQYIEPATVRLFTSLDAKSNRGLGFDKPRKVKYPSYSDNMPPEAFGHTGFTGTCAWADPSRKMVYIFLSNRVHPRAQNTEFFNNNIRKRIHEVVYDALDSYRPGWGGK